MPSEFFNRQHNQEEGEKKITERNNTQFTKKIYRATHCTLSKREHCAPVVKLNEIVT